MGPHFTAAMPRQVSCARGISCGRSCSSMYIALVVRSRSRTRPSSKTRPLRLGKQRFLLHSEGFAVGSKWKNVDRFCSTFNTATVEVLQCYTELYVYSGARTNLKVGGTGPKQKWGAAIQRKALEKKVFWVVPSTFSL